MNSTDILCLILGASFVLLGIFNPDQFFKDIEKNSPKRKYRRILYFIFGIIIIFYGVKSFFGF